MQNLARAGARELLIVSQDTSAYGVDLCDTGPVWTQLVPVPDPDVNWHRRWKRAGRLESRLHYDLPYPHVGKVIPLMAAGKITCHLDIPVPARQPKILKAMKRPPTPTMCWRAHPPMAGNLPRAGDSQHVHCRLSRRAEADFQELLDFITAQSWIGPVALPIHRLKALPPTPWLIRCRQMWPKTARRAFMAVCRRLFRPTPGSQGRQHHQVSSSTRSTMKAPLKAAAGRCAGNRRTGCIERPRARAGGRVSSGDRHIPTNTICGPSWLDLINALRLARGWQHRSSGPDTGTTEVSVNLGCGDAGVASISCNCTQITGRLQHMAMNE